MALGFIIGFVVGAALVLFALCWPLAHLSEDRRNEIIREIQLACWQQRKK